MTGIQRNRQRLSALSHCQFIEPYDFIARATSRQNLLRADDPQAGVHGLLDPITGIRFFVEDEKLDRWHNEAP